MADKETFGASMKIASFEIRNCVQRQEDPDWSFARGGIPELRGWVVVVTDEQGFNGYGYAHALPSITGHGEGVKAALDFLLPRIVGRDARDRKAVAEDMDVALAFHPSAKAAIEMSLHDLVARKAGLPLGALFGGRFRSSIPQSRIIALKSPEKMAEVALRLATEGYGTLKLKMSGDVELDVARVAAVRSVVGPTVILTLDANQSYSAKRMQRAFAQMERYGIALIEQPVPAADWAGLAHLTRTLPVAIEADESAASVQDVARLVRDRVVDVVNVKVPKFGGIGKTLAAIALCEAGGIGCRFGAAFGPSLLQAVSAHLAAGLRNLEFACELAEHEHLLDDPFAPLPVLDGALTLPDMPGSGVAPLSVAASNV